jgi:carbon monoxide dehydrogenase subunit G
VGSGRAQTTIDRPAQEVWAEIGDFRRVDWIPGIVAFRLQTESIRLISVHGMNLVEQLTSYDDEARTYTYSVQGLPVEQHSATLTVTPQGESSSVVTWDTTTDDHMVAVLRDGCQVVLDQLRARLGAAP